MTPGRLKALGQGCLLAMAGAALAAGPAPRTLIKTPVRAAPAASSSTQPATRPPARPLARGQSPAADWARGEVDRALDKIASGAAPADVQAELDGLFDAVILYGSDEALSALTEIAWGRRVVSQVGALDKPQQAPLLQFLRQNRALADALCMNLGDDDDVPAVYAVLDQLRAAHADELNDYANLAAAVCLVHDRPIKPRVAEMQSRIPDPLAVFDYYRGRDKQLAFGARVLPVPLMAHLVDTTTSVQEMAWALGRYRGNRQVGQRFFDIRYDDQAYLTGSAIQARRGDYSLPNILRFGGVCADQAYYAVAVGKSIGVPAAICAGQSGEAAHAWVGYLQRLPSGVRWNFDEGRYDEYRGVRGVVLDPLSGKAIPDSYVSLLAELATVDPDDQLLAVALTDAALRLESLAGDSTTRPAGNADLAKKAAEAMSAAGVALAQEPRGTQLSDELDLLNRAITASDGYLRPWLQVARLAEAAKLNLDQKRSWSDLLLKLYAGKYPDLTLALIDPMVRSIEDVREQDRMWSALFRMFPVRDDLCAQIRLRQAEMWIKANNRARAADCYQDVVNRYSASGPSAVTALSSLEKLLKDAGQGGRVLDLYARAWPKMQRPTSGAEFAKQSNWYVVGQMYADRLDLAGLPQKADGVRAQLFNASRFADKND